MHTSDLGGRDCPVISVVLPVRDAMPYLTCSLQALVDAACRDLEIILVNDGSGDGSGRICDYYAGCYPHLFRVMHQKPYGWAVAANRGLELTRGSYVHFHEAGDYVAADFYARLLQAVCRQGADICRGEMLICQGGKLIKQDHTNRLLNRYRSRFFFCEQWQTAIYRRAMLDKYHIRFDENLEMSHGLLFLHEAVLRCRGLAAVDNAHYCLCPRNAGTDARILPAAQLRSALEVARRIADSLIAHQTRIDRPALQHILTRLMAWLEHCAARRTRDPDCAVRCRQLAQGLLFSSPPDCHAALAQYLHRTRCASAAAGWRGDGEELASGVRSAAMRTPKENRFCPPPQARLRTCSLCRC